MRVIENIFYANFYQHHTIHKEKFVSWVKLDDVKIPTEQQPT